MHPLSARRLALVVIALTGCYGALLAFYFESVNAGLIAETPQAAITLLERGFIGNPYHAESGPTAHVAPGLIVIIAAAYKIFGPAAAGGRIVLSLIAAGLYVLSQYLVVRVLDARRAPPVAYAILAALFILTGPNIYQSIVEYRIWDQPYAAAILVGAWLLLERARARGPAPGDVVRLALLTVLGSLYSPAVLPPMCLAGAHLVWCLPRGRERLRAAIGGVLILVAGLLPWAIRNEVMMGKFILTRSNFPLEFAMGNFPDVTGGLTQAGLFLDTYHPYFSARGRKEVAELGEARFMEQLAAVNKELIRADPWRIVGLTVMRVRYLFLPSTEPALVFWHPLIGTAAVGILLAALTVLRLLTLAASAALDRGLLRDGILFTVLPLAPYVTTHVEIRYLYMIAFTSTLFTTLTATRIWEARRLRSNAAAST